MVIPHSSILKHSPLLFWPATGSHPDAIASQQVNEESELVFQASAIDPDVPADTLTYSLDEAPTGATINPSTGTFRWTPTEADGPGMKNVTLPRRRR